MKKEIKEIFDMGFNGNVSNYIDYDVIDYDDGTFLGIEECEQIYEEYSDFCCEFAGFVRETKIVTGRYKALFQMAKDISDPRYQRRES